MENNLSALFWNQSPFFLIQKKKGSLDHPMPLQNRGVSYLCKCLLFIGLPQAPCLNEEMNAIIDAHNAGKNKEVRKKRMNILTGEIFVDNLALNKHLSVVSLSGVVHW